MRENVALDLAKLRVPKAGDSLVRYQFANSRLRDLALTHVSYCRDPLDSYERLEYLGDRLLGLVVSLAVYLRTPHANEDQIAQITSELTCNSFLKELALQLGLDKMIRISDPGSLHKKGSKVLADVVEALIAAVFVDATCSHNLGHAFGVIYSITSQLLADFLPHPANDSVSVEFDCRTGCHSHVANSFLFANSHSVKGGSGKCNDRRAKRRVPSTHRKRLTELVRIFNAPAAQFSTKKFYAQGGAKIKLFSCVVSVGLVKAEALGRTRAEASERAAAAALELLLGQEA